MRKPLIVGIALAVLLVALAVALPRMRTRLREAAKPPGTVPASAAPAPTPTASPAVSSSPIPAAASPSAPPKAPSPRGVPTLRTLGRARLDTQIGRVVESMDRTGGPPAEVAQGGRRGGKRGVFVNAERRLPVKPSGYYRECDVWPARGGARGGERLVFGRSDEVYYSPDHYRSFQRLR